MKGVGLLTEEERRVLLEGLEPRKFYIVEWTRLDRRPYQKDTYRTFKTIVANRYVAGVVEKELRRVKEITEVKTYPA
jgi:hypothetical protein